MALIILYLSGYLNSHSPFPVYKYMNFLFLYFFTKFGFYILHFQKKYANIIRHDFCRVDYDAWLSLVERCVRDAEVAGSNPVASILGRGTANP